jgi:hypothetical protein
MTAVDDVDQLIEQYQQALDEFMKGNPEPVKKLFSHREDVTLANPLGPPAHGWEQVGATIEHAASQFRDGQLVSVEIVEKHATPEFAYTVWLERAEAKVGGTPPLNRLQGRNLSTDSPHERSWSFPPLSVT